MASNEISEQHEQTRRLAKKAKRDVSLVDCVQSHIFHEEKEMTNEYAQAKPYPHGVLKDLFHPKFLNAVLSEIKQNSKVNFKESDLFRVYQSIDMANLTEDEHIETHPTVLELRQVLYSDEWRSLIERLCGVQKGTLTGQVDCAFNCHTTGCHLLCHDDVIGTRKISYILYLTEIDWATTEGGALELYDRCSSTQNAQPKSGKLSTSDASENAAAATVPESTPSCTILPLFNHMAFFAVQPGVSFHSVQEVFGERPRLSLQGWYHAVKTPDQMEAATLRQLKQSGGEDTLPFTPFVYPESILSSQDREYLASYIHETYLTDDALENIIVQFEEDSSVQLRNFLCLDWISKINRVRKEAEDATTKSILETGYYEQGTSSEWRLVGPAHKQRFLEYIGTSSSSASSKDLDSVGAMLLHLQEKLLCSIPFQRFLARITSLGLPLGHKGRIRRFRKGLDYTVAHYGILTRKSVLDATLCFVAGEGGKAEDQADENDATNNETKDDPELETENTDDMMWQSGDCGGFECYIAADDDNDETNEDEAADEYDQDDDTELLSVSPSNNTLSLVYRDPGTMRFVKYVGSSAPSSRWDVSMEYDVEDQEGDEGEEEDEEHRTNADENSAC